MIRLPRITLLSVLLALAIAMAIFIGVRLALSDEPPKIGRLTMPAPWWESETDEPGGMRLLPRADQEDDGWQDAVDVGVGK